MWLESLHIQHFRNYGEAELSFHKGLNIFLGQNAQGKTNILEGIYFLALTRSHRTKTDKDLLQFSEKHLQVNGILHRSTGKVPLDIDLTDRGRITKVNHLKQTRLSDYIGQLNVILFAPEDLQLVKGGPALRRKFIDVELGQIKPLYLSDLSNYNHILKQRNAYLKASDKVADAAAILPCNSTLIFAYRLYQNFSVAFFQTQLYLLALASNLVPSIYSTSVSMTSRASIYLLISTNISSIGIASLSLINLSKAI